MPPHKTAPPQQADFDPDTEPQPYIGGFNPWRELSPEHDLAREKQLELYGHERDEISQLVASVFHSGRGPELLELMKKMAKAAPRETYDQVLRRDSKLDMLDWIDQEIQRVLNG